MHPPRGTVGIGACSIQKQASVTAPSGRFWKITWVLLVNVLLPGNISIGLLCRLGIAYQHKQAKSNQHQDNQ